MGKTILRAVALVVMLALLALMVPTFTPLAVAEEFTEYPVYEPVTLPLTDVPTIDYQADTPYAPHADAYLPDETGYLDRLYVHKDYQGQGIASAICDELERFATGKTFTTHASITAKLFFQHRGYHVVRKQEVIRHGVALTNFVMEKQPERAK